MPGKGGTEVEEGGWWLMKKEFNEQMRREKGTISREGKEARSSKT